MLEELDAVALHCKAAGIRLARNCVLVEGTSDVEYFNLASELENKKHGIVLLDDDFQIVAAGRADRGGVDGVVRELITLRNLAQYILTPKGRAKYRFAGLLDNDYAGQRALTRASGFDTSIVEFKDIFRIWPKMPIPGINDPRIAKNLYDKENTRSTNFSWELEDFLPKSILADFEDDYPGQIIKEVSFIGGMHRELSKDGKENLRRHVLKNGMHTDLLAIIEVMRVLRFFMNAPKK